MPVALSLTAALSEIIRPDGDNRMAISYNIGPSPSLATTYLTTMASLQRSSAASSVIIPTTLFSAESAIACVSPPLPVSVFKLAKVFPMNMLVLYKTTEIPCEP